MIYAKSPVAALLLLHAFAQGLWCPWCMGSSWWQHLHIPLLVFAMNPGDLSTHPFPVITSISVSSFSFHLVPPPGRNVPTVAFQLPRDVHPPPSLCWADASWQLMAGSEVAALFAEVAACLGFCLWKESKPSGACCRCLSLLRACLPLTSGLLCCRWHPQGLHRRGHEPRPHYLFLDWAQHAHWGHLGICTTVLHVKWG